MFVSTSTLALKGYYNLAYNNFVNQCVVSLAQLAMKLFHDSYDLLSMTHLTRQVGGDLVNMFTHSLIQNTVSP